MIQPPLTVQLDVGTHWLCTCGRSQNFPHCDGSHAGTSLKPLALELETPKTIEISGVNVAPPS